MSSFCIAGKLWKAQPEPTSLRLLSSADLRGLFYFLLNFPAANLERAEKATLPDNITQLLKIA
jgi:hypothetical protein